MHTLLTKGLRAIHFDQIADRTRISLWFFAVIIVVEAQLSAVLIGLRATTFDLSLTFELAHAQQDSHVEQKRRTDAPHRKRDWVRSVWQGIRHKPTAAT